MNSSALIAQANCFRIPLPDRSVHCCVTSPPYWGLRKYAGDQGDEPLGLEPTPERHIERTVQWAREVHRVLRDDGVAWINYGDVYATSQNGRAAADIVNDDRTFRDKPFNTAEFLPAGNLMLMPHRVALALQADGWIVRQDLVWAKPNPMPESVAGWRWQDGELRRGSFRHTRSHEYVFMLTKQMQYWSDQEAVREITGSEMSHAEYATKTEPGATWQSGGLELNAGQHKKDGGLSHPGGRNPRSVLHIATAPYKGSHYATFPPALIAPLILATCPRWCCPVCGQGWAPVVEKTVPPRHEEKKGKKAHSRNDGDIKVVGDAWYEFKRNSPDSVSGHRPTCGCAAGLSPDDLETIATPTGNGTDDPTMQTGRKGMNRRRNESEGVRLTTRYEQRRYAEQIKASRSRAKMRKQAGEAFAHYIRTDSNGARPVPYDLLETWITAGWIDRVEIPTAKSSFEAVPGIVCDPFVGSGTTVMVAQQLLRRGIGFDLSMEYLDLQATLRTGIGSPSNQLDNLPLFST